MGKRDLAGESVLGSNCKPFKCSICGKIHGCSVGKSENLCGNKCEIGADQLAIENKLKFMLVTNGKTVRLTLCAMFCTAHSDDFIVRQAREKGVCLGCASEITSLSVDEKTKTGFMYDFSPYLQLPLLKS